MRFDRLRCRLRVGPPLHDKAAYALRMLLRPLGLRPLWVPEHDSDAVAIAYGDVEPQPGCLAIRPADPSGSFFSTRTRLLGVPAAHLDWGNTTAPVPLAGGVSVDGAPFTPLGDWIASAFYWLAGWDEWTRADRDRHGRVRFAGSAHERWECVDLPVVDVYRLHLEASLRAIGQLPDPPHESGPASVGPALCPTHDLDYERKWSRGVIYRELWNGLSPRGSGSGWNRLSRVAGSVVGSFRSPQLDPYEVSFSEMVKRERAAGAGATYFLKTAGRGAYDARNRPDGPIGTQRLHVLREGGFEIGLHPSYFASRSPGRYTDEKRALEAAIGGAVGAVRHHYLRWDVGRTPALLESLGLTLDSTLAYAEREGFRRGTCHPFQLYDLGADRTVDVWEAPLCVMDSTLVTYRKMSVERAVEATLNLMETCRRFDGMAVALWHNILYDPFDYPGWHAVFEAALGQAAKAGTRVAGLQKELSTRGISLDERTHRSHT